VLLNISLYSFSAAEKLQLQTEKEKIHLWGKHRLGTLSSCLLLESFAHNIVARHSCSLTLEEL